MSMFPIRCVVETVLDGHCANCFKGDTDTIVDSYAIVAGHTPLSQLVETVLTALGLQHLITGAKGTIQMKNWKELTFDQITNEPDVDIESLLKDVSNHSTLKILACRRSDINECAKDMKDRLLRAAVQKVPNILDGIKQSHLKDFVSHLVHNPQQPSIDSQTVNLFNAWLDDWCHSSNDKAVTDVQQTTTIRFSPLLEVPKLDRWFKECSNPSRPKLLRYMNILNGSNFRKHTSKITYQQICNWFSNARASLRKRPGYGTRTSGTGSSSTNTWNSKVFGSQVRNASMAFNEFIQPTSETNAPCGANASCVKLTAPTNLQIGPWPNDEGRSSSTSDTTSITIKGCLEEDLKMNNIEVDDVNSSPSPTFALKSLTDGLPTISASSDTITRCGLQPSSTLGYSNLNRTRLMFDPLTELPVLEKWFEENRHPSWVQIDQYTEALNFMPYRRTYPPVSSHNVKIWFKNRRAKCKRRSTVSESRL